MVHVTVLGVALDRAQQHVILLKPVGQSIGEGRILPVWIGAQEATAILFAVEGVAPPRPLAHDLMTSILVALDARVERVEVTRLDEGTFYAEVVLVTPQGMRVLDARPSDAIALASRADATIWVADEVFAEAAVADDVSESEGATEGRAEKDEEKLAAFRRFLDDVDPEDFQG